LERVLVIGFNARPIAVQAKKCGFKVFAVDYWGDVDIYGWVDDIVVLKDYVKAGSDLAELTVKFSEQMARKHGVDGVLVGSGLDDRWECLSRLERVAPIIGNKPSKVREVRSKLEVYEKVKREGIMVPETFLVESRKEAVRASREIGFPVIVRREAGGGGLGIHLAHNEREVEQKFSQLKGKGRVLVQEYIAGDDVSASVLCTGKKAVTVTVNRQLIGVSWLGGREFVYCGNIVPHEKEEIRRRVSEAAEKICRSLSVLGCNGVDFVVRGGQPVFMEVNPRFQGTLECVSMVTGMNIVREHINACQGRVPSKISVKGFAVKNIVFAKENCVIPDLHGIPFLFDITQPRSLVEEGEPICSVQLACLKLEECIRRAKKVVVEVYSKIDEYNKKCGGMGV